MRKSDNMMKHKHKLLRLSRPGKKGKSSRGCSAKRSAVSQKECSVSNQQALLWSNENREEDLECDLYEADTPSEDDDADDCESISDDGYLFIGAEATTDFSRTSGDLAASVDELSDCRGGDFRDIVCRAGEATGFNKEYLSLGETASADVDNIDTTQLLAESPVADESFQYDAFFLHHGSDRDWTRGLISRLQDLGLNCCSHQRCLDHVTSLRTSALAGIRSSRKTCLVLSPAFVQDVWYQDDMDLLSERDVQLIQRDLVLVLVEECDLPGVLLGVGRLVDISQADWWRDILGLISATDLQEVKEFTSGAPSGAGSSPGLCSGQLLLSVRSGSRCCGGQSVDPGQIPEELPAHGIHISPEEYRSAIGHLMVDVKFRCHVCCYNVPAALVFFTFLLGLCLAVIPLIEAKLVFHGRETGLEFVHAGVAWLCALTLYMLLMQISKWKMKRSANRRLVFVNSILVKHNILAGVEDLGFADCNKYFLHFFYYEIGPCLAYLQELAVHTSDHGQPNCPHGSLSDTIQFDCDDSVQVDMSLVLNNTPLTNNTIQTRAEDMLLAQSGEYITKLITKQLDGPPQSRHLKGHQCLCQYVSQRQRNTVQCL